MRLVIQRVGRASVSWRDASDQDHIEKVGRGLAILCGSGPEDDLTGVRRLAQRVANLRVFPAEGMGFDRSLLDIEGEALVVSQFTLYADTRRGRRPGFSSAAEPAAARTHYEAFADALRNTGVPTRTGSFGASMKVEIENDGPVTLVVSTAPWETAL